jgi:hypothetical protein
MYCRLHMLFPFFSYHHLFCYTNHERMPQDYFSQLYWRERERAR